MAGTIAKAESKRLPAPESVAPVLEVINVTKTFPNGRTVLNGISFQVLPEETFVILGGSGCGKSTLLNILIGVLEATSGQIRIFGEDLRSLRGSRLKAVHVRCGMLFQSGALIESLSLVDNIHLPLREHYRGMDPDPDLVFADEPTSGLDPISTREIDEMFIRLTRRIGAAAVVVTHDISSFFRIAHRAVMLGGERDGDLQGQVIMQGCPEDFRASRRPAVRRFFGSGESETPDRNK